MKKTTDKIKKEKKLYLTTDEQRNLESREALLAQHEFYKYMLNNSIVEYLKGVVYRRLSLDLTKDYAISSDAQGKKYVIVKEEDGSTDSAK